MTVLLLKQQKVPYLFRKLTTAYTKFITQTRNKILGEIIVLDIGHRQTAPPGSQDSFTNWCWLIYNQYRHSILYVQFLFT